MLITKLEKLTITETKIKNIIKKINQKVKELQEETNTIKQINIIDEISTERNHYLTLYWASYIGYLKNITDEKYLKSEEIIAKYDGEYNNSIYKMYEVISSLDNKVKLIEKYGKRFLAIANNQKILLSKNTELRQKELELRKKYRKILNSPKVKFNDEEISLTRLTKYLQSDIEAERIESHNLRYEELLKISDELENIFKELLEVRKEIAIKTNFSNFYEHEFIKMNRIDYNKDDLASFTKQIIKYFVPLREKLKLAQTKRLGEEKLSYYNSSILFKNGNAKTEYDLHGIEQELEKILEKLSPEFSSLYNDMNKNGMIDLEERENKSAGGITTFLPDYKYPIFIKRYINNSNNFTVLAHEFGHSLQLYYNKEKHLHENRWPTFDICEIHSTTMELLVNDNSESVFKEDTTKHLISHFTSIIELLIRTTCVNEFQTKIYSEDNLDINKTWKEIYKKYYPTNDYDIDYFNKGIMWQADINRIDDPFYGIDYALAAFYALLFYKNYKETPSNTINQFIDFCKIGGEISFKEIAEKYNFNSPFEEETHQRLADFLSEKIEELLEVLVTE